MKFYFKLAFYYIKARMVLRIRRRLLLKLIQKKELILLFDLSKAGILPKNWIKRIRLKPLLYEKAGIRDSSELKNLFPQHSAKTIELSDQVLLHKFDLLGSGPYKPIDKDRVNSADDYQPIDWYFDPVSGEHFPKGILCTDWKLYKMRPGSADIKLPWELARCQHLVLLGQSYQLTSDEKYALEIANQLKDFVEANPICIGINWACTMDVALRAANWSIALELIRGSKLLDDDFWFFAYDALYKHGKFIRNNLEDFSEVKSNHYLSNIVGLLYIATIFESLPEGKEWQSFCCETLEKEIKNQTLDDGANFESSFPYHRLVVELFLGALRISEISGVHFSEDFKKTLEKMINFLICILRPDGLMPQYGDSDDGRLHIFTHYGDWNPQDSRHILAPAAFQLQRPEFLNYAGIDGLWEAAWWGFDIKGIKVKNIKLPFVSKLFSEAGHFVFRNEETYLLGSNSVVGTKGVGNHKHNDQLAFEFHSSGVPLLIDAGSYAYTSDAKSRNLFRSTGFHNTLRVDGVEQNEMNPNWLFRMFEMGRPEHLEFYNKDRVLQYHGQHIGYKRLRSPIIHERYFQLLKNEGVLFIVDMLKGKGKHFLEWHFHCAPGIRLSDDGGNILWMAKNKKTFGLLSIEGVPRVIKKGWCSSSYGKKERCSVVDFSCHKVVSDSPGSNVWAYIVAPAKWFNNNDHNEAVRALKSKIGINLP